MLEDITLRCDKSSSRTHYLGIGRVVWKGALKLRKLSVVPDFDWTLLIYDIFAQNRHIFECGMVEDFALHALVKCVSFDAQQSKLRVTVELYLSLLTVIVALAGVCEKWLAVIRFSKNIMKIKEVGKVSRNA